MHGDDFIFRRVHDTVAAPLDERNGVADAVDSQRFSAGAVARGITAGSQPSEPRHVESRRDHTLPQFDRV